MEQIYKKAKQQKHCILLLKSLVHILINNGGVHELTASLKLGFVNALKNTTFSSKDLAAPAAMTTLGADAIIFHDSFLHYDDFCIASF